MEIKDFSKDFLDDIMEILKASFKIPWTRDMILSCAADENVRFKICFFAGKAAGFCIYRTAAGETEILNIAVKPGMRRRCAARQMLAYMEKDAKKDLSEKVFLEVRESNTAAINLYASCGFEKIAVRKKYYTDEDAIVLRKII